MDQLEVAKGFPREYLIIFPNGERYIMNKILIARSNHLNKVLLGSAVGEQRSPCRSLTGPLVLKAEEFAVIYFSYPSRDMGQEFWLKENLHLWLSLVPEGDEVFVASIGWSGFRPWEVTGKPDASTFFKMPRESVLSAIRGAPDAAVWGLSIIGNLETCDGDAHFKRIIEFDVTQQGCLPLMGGSSQFIDTLGRLMNLSYPGAVIMEAANSLEAVKEFVKEVGLPQSF